MVSETGGEPVATLEKGEGSETGPIKSKFRFKSGKSTTRSDRESTSRRHRRSRSPSEHSKDEERHYRHHHRSKRRRHSPVSSKHTVDDPSLYDDTYLPNSSSDQFIDPERAFRESLFDAMADDEGAQFWEGVYGQAIHKYPDVKQGPAGELERMTEDEYAAHVRAKMYEKTHQHLVEEKARRDAAKKEKERLARESAKEEREAEKFRQKVEESLRRGDDRKKRRAWAEKWELYVQRWDNLGNGASGNIEIASIPWPVESGKQKDVLIQEVERFFLYAPTSGQPTETQLSKILKTERIRWHPDKIQQKLGGQDVGANIMEAVTAVFQIIDRMWSEVRKDRR